MPIKKSVRLTDNTCRTLHHLTASGETNWSGSINQMAVQYEMLISDNMPTLTKKERMALCCCYNGHMPHPDIQQELEMLPWRVDQGYQYDNQVTELLGTPEDAWAFAEKVKAWTASQRLAAIYMAKAYWRQGPTKVDR